MFVRSGVPLTNQDFTKWDKHQIETLHAELCKNILCVQRKTPNNAEIGRYPLIIKIQKRAVKFYNHLKGNDSQTLHNKAITYREMNLEKSPISKMVLRLCSQTQTDPTEPQDSNIIGLNQNIRKQKDASRMLLDTLERINKKTKNWNAIWL